MTQEEILGIIRHILTALGGVLVTKGVVDSGTVEIVSGAAITVIGAAWSIFQKRKAAKILAVAIASPAK